MDITAKIESVDIMLNVNVGGVVHQTKLITIPAAALQEVLGEAEKPKRQTFQEKMAEMMKIQKEAGNAV